MENEMQHEAEATLDHTLDQLVARLMAAVERFESAQQHALPGVNVAASEAVGPIVATVESSREAELAQKLAEAERTIAGLRANASTHTQEGRRTLSVSLLAKQENSMSEPNALDAALGSLSASLSMEQRIAVKSQLLRAGLV